MKKILIATDLSAASRNAFLYGLQLSKAIDANIILFNAYQVSHSIGALNVHISHYDAMKQIELKLEDEVSAVNNDNRLPIEIICDEGVAEDAILTIANEKGANLIIVGMKGSGKNMKELFGSTTTSLYRRSNIPLFIIHGEAKFSALKNVLYASDVFLDAAILNINQIEWIIELCKPKIYVVRVVKNEDEALLEQLNVLQELRAEYRATNTTYNFPVNTNISDGLNKFIQDKKIDLLIMRPHKHDWIERLFVKSETKDMIFHTHIPLLVLPEMPVQESS